MNLKKLREALNAKIEEMQALLAKAVDEERPLSEDETTQIDDMKRDVKALEKTIEEAELLERYTISEGKKDKDEIEERSVNERATFEAFLRGDERAATNMTKTDNGAVIPETIANNIIKKVYDLSPVLERSQHFNIKGKVQLPKYDDATGVTAAYAEEFKALESSSGKFGSITLEGFLSGALCKVSRSLINNNKFDIVTFVEDDVAQAIARFCEKEILNGTVGKVTGLSTATNKITAAAANKITADELIDVQDSVKDAFQANAIWIMSSKTRTAIRKLKDANDRYLLQDDITAPFGKILLGKPVYVSDNMPEMVAAKNAIYYGDMKALATRLGEEPNVQVLREKYADEHVVGVIGWVEFDAKIQNEQGVAVLTMKAS